MNFAHSNYPIFYVPSLCTLMSAFHWTQGNAEGLRNLCRYELKHRASVCPSMCSAALGFQSLSSLINFGKLVVLIMNQ